MTGQWYNKPPRGTPIERVAPLARNLLAFWPVWEGSQGPTDLAGGLSLPLGSGASWGIGAALGLVCNANTAYAQATAPAALQLSGPLTLAVGFRQLGTPYNVAMIAGTTYDSTFTAPYYSYGFQFNTSSTAVAFEINVSGTLQSIGGATVAAGSDFVLSASHQSGSQILYQNGVQVGTGSHSGNPTYGSGPVIAMGSAGAVNRDPNVLIYWMGIWSRVLQAAEHQTLAASPWQLFRSLYQASLFQARSSFMPWLFGDQIQEAVG